MNFRKRSQPFLTIWILFALLLSMSGCQSCRRHPSATGSIQGQVVDPNGSPIAGVQVTAPGVAPVGTNAQGEFKLSGLPLVPRLAVSFSAQEFMKTTQVYEVSAARGKNVVVIWPRAKAVPVDAATGGKVTFPAGGGLTIPPNGLVDEEGRPVTGPVQVSLTYLDVSNPEQLEAAPGDFTARMRDGSERKLESFGIFEVVVVDEAGQRAELARGQTSAIELPIPRPFLNRAPERTGLFSFDASRGQWVEEGSLSRRGLVYSGTIDRFDWSWNADIPEETTCMTFRVIMPGVDNNQPAPNCLVKATGVSYGSTSKGYTDNNGLVCLLVKRNSQVKIQAFSTQVQSYVSVPEVITSPDIASGAGDCGNQVTCPYKTIKLDIIVGGSAGMP